MNQPSTATVIAITDHPVLRLNYERAAPRRLAHGITVRWNWHRDYTRQLQQLFVERTFRWVLAHMIQGLVTVNSD